MNIKIKFYTTISLFVLVLAGIVVFILYPTTKEIIRLSSLIQSERTELEQKYQAGQRLRETAEALEKIEDNQELLNSVFVREGEAAAFSQQLEALAATHRLEQTIQAQAPTNGKFRLTQTLRGNFHNVLNYLQAMESLEQYMNTVLLSITVTGIRDTNTVQATIQSDSYLLEQ